MACSIPLSEHPVVEYWDFDKNSSNLPTNYTIKSREKVFWRCSNNHSFKSIIKTMVNNFKCPKCNSLGYKHPELAEQWHPQLNGNLTPYDFSYGTRQKAHWLCKNNHTYHSSIGQRVKGSGCPYCSGHKLSYSNTLACKNPELSSEWDKQKNGKLTPENVHAMSSKKAHWMCRHGHEWLARISSRNEGAGCSQCKGLKASKTINLEVQHPTITAEWDYKKNETHTPRTITSGSDYEAFWICGEKGHSWQTTIHHRTYRGDGCPSCSGRRISIDNNFEFHYPELAKEWHPKLNGDLKPSQVFPSGAQFIYWLCKDKNHTWRAPLYSRTAGKGCPKCYSRSSKLEILIYSELLYYIKTAKLDFLYKNISIDIFLPEQSLAIEVDGSWWHENKVEFDIQKGRNLKDCNITLIRLRAEPLQHTNQLDISYSEKDEHVDVLHQLFSHLLQNNLLPIALNNRIRSRLLKPTLNNISLYNKLYASRFSPPFEKSIEGKFPHLISEWDYEKNNGLVPADFFAFSDTKAFWRCKNNHSYSSVIKNRTRGSQCPECDGRKVNKENCLATTHPLLVKQWYYFLNDGLTPDNVTYGSGKKVYWCCEDGHIWPARIYSRTRGNGCPKCRKNRNYK